MSCHQPVANQRNALLEWRHLVVAGAPLVAIFIAKTGTVPSRTRLATAVSRQIPTMSRPCPACVTENTRQTRLGRRSDTSVMKTTSPEMYIYKLSINTDATGNGFPGIGTSCFGLPGTTNNYGNLFCFIVGDVTGMSYKFSKIHFMCGSVWNDRTFINASHQFS